MMAIPAAIVALIGPNIVQRVIAIGDCRPAALAFEATKSKSAQMRSMIKAAYSRVQHLLAVHVPRTLNTAADRLSHPLGADEVSAEATAFGLTVARATIPVDVWALLRGATLLPMAVERNTHLTPRT